MLVSLYGILRKKTIYSLSYYSDAHGLTTLQYDNEPYLEGKTV